jgi:GNAT superfamily N-acetyltransferase
VERVEPRLRLVPIADADLDAVAALVNRAFGRYSDLFTGQRTSPGDYLVESGDDARVLLVEDAATGSLLASSMVTAPAERFLSPDLTGPAGTDRVDVPFEADPFHPWTGAFYYGLAGVEPATMNRGLGRLMVERAESLAADEGFSRIALGTVREFGLVDYYERLGYRVVHEDVHPIGHWDFLVPHHYCEMVKDL